MTPDSPPRLYGSNDRIRKRWHELAVPPHLGDWDTARGAFHWDQARQAMAGLPGGALNIAHEAVDRHADGPAGDRVAIRWLGADGRSQRISYRDLRDRCNRVANLLCRLGLRRGDTLFILAPHLPDAAAVLLGALKAGLVVAPLQADAGPDPIATRLAQGGGRALLTTAALYRGLVAPLRASLPHLEQVLLLADGDAGPPPEGTLDLTPLVQAASADFQAVPTLPDELALLHFTPGATGQPKGVLQAHEAVLGHWATGRLALDLHPGDVLWCSVVPGDAAATVCGLLAPLLQGVTVVMDEADFDPAHALDVLDQQGVTVWCTTPTAIRRLMKAGPGALSRHRLSRLRLVVSLGEALPVQAVLWGQEALGQPIHDQWWQAEAGGILIANTPSLDIKPGAMGKPLPGVQACVIHRRADGSVEVVTTTEAEGELALRSGWPSMFRGYLGEALRYQKRFVRSAEGMLYLTGDLVRRDADGYVWFVGAADEVIKSSGHTIGPAEVEAALLTHPAVADAAVVGQSDPVLGQTGRAFVVLQPGVDRSDALRRALLAHARQHLGPVWVPQAIDFCSQLPRTRNGKLMRRLVKDQAVRAEAAGPATVFASMSS